MEGTPQPALLRFPDRKLSVVDKMETNLMFIIVLWPKSGIYIKYSMHGSYLYPTFLCGCHMIAVLKCAHCVISCSFFVEMAVCPVFTMN